MAQLGSALLAPVAVLQTSLSNHTGILASTAVEVKRDSLRENRIFETSSTENAAYRIYENHDRIARNALLQQEVALRRQMEAVAAELRSLPPGGEIPEDYLFDRIGDDGAPATVQMSELFGLGDTLMLYHYMFPRHSQDNRSGPTRGDFAELPLEEGPCPSCTALIDMWEGTMPHFEGLGGNLVVVAKAPIQRVAAFAHDRNGRTSDSCRPRTTTSDATMEAITPMVSLSRS